MIQELLSAVGLGQDDDDFDREWAEEVAERAARRQLEMA